MPSWGSGEGVYQRRYILQTGEYDVNQYDVNQYDVNQYDVNQLLHTAAHISTGNSEISKLLGIGLTYEILTRVLPDVQT